MDFKYINAAILQYEKMTPEEVREQIKPIIKSYDRGNLAFILGCSVENLYSYCKKCFVDMGKKPNFEYYVKIMALGVQTEEQKNINKSVNKPSQKDKTKEYQRKYYQEVTKKKRAEKSNSQ